jgi:1,4-alpha-glucan branching enzyme
VRRDGDDHAVVVLNLTPIPHEEYRVGAPAAGANARALDSDDPRVGGSGFGAHARVETESSPFHGFPQSLRLRLPPLGALVLVPEPPRDGAPVPPPVADAAAES